MLTVILLSGFILHAFTPLPIQAQGKPTLGGQPVSPNANPPTLGGQPVSPNANAPTLNGQFITPQGASVPPGSNPAAGSGANTAFSGGFPFVFSNGFGNFSNSFGNGAAGLGLGTGLGTALGGYYGYFPFGYTAGYPGYLSYGGWGQPGFVTSIGGFDKGYSYYSPPDPQSMLIYEEARSKYIDNMRKWTREYARMREAAEMYRREKLARERHSPEALAKAAELPRLSREQYDPVTGALMWPDALKGDEFAAERQEIEQLFEWYARTSQRADAATRIRELTDEMSEHLRNNIDSLTATDFVAARKFLDAMEATVAAPNRG
jgi:hypothetical protein